MQRSLFYGSYCTHFTKGRHAGIQGDKVANGFNILIATGSFLTAGITSIHVLHNCVLFPVAYEGGGGERAKAPPFGPTKRKKWRKISNFYENNTKFWV